MQLCVVRPLIDGARHRCAAVRESSRHLPNICFEMNGNISIDQFRCGELDVAHRAMCVSHVGQPNRVSEITELDLVVLRMNQQIFRLCDSDKQR